MRILALLLMLSAVPSMAHADDLSDFGRSLYGRIAMTPQPFYPENAGIAILQFPNVPSIGFVMNPSVSQVVEIVQQRKDYWQAVLDGARTRIANGDPAKGKLEIKADLARAVIADAQADLAFLAQLPQALSDGRNEERVNAKTALMRLMYEKSRALATP